MRKYLALARAALLDAVQEKAEIMIWVLLDALPVFIMASLWLSNRTQVTIMSISQLITYYIIAMIIGRLTEFFFDEDMGELVRTGEFSKYLLKPLRFPAAFIPQTFGRKLFSGFVMITPIVAVIGIFFRQYLVFPSKIQLLLFLLSLIITLGIRYSLSTLAAAGAFFWEQSGALTHVRWVLEIVAGGYILPLSFYPSWLRIIPESLPIKYIYYVPISIYTGIFDNKTALSTLAIGTLWLPVMIFAAHWVWRKGITRYSGVGG